MPSKTIIVGCPGAGKTTTLLDLMDSALDSGIRPDQIGFISFTKKASTEAMTRACERFGLVEDDLPYVRTLHSLVYRQLGLDPTQVIQRKHYAELGEKLGLEVKGTQTLEEGAHYGMASGDRLFFVENLARTRCVDIRAQWIRTNDDSVDWWELERLHRGLASYKSAHGLTDFTDMLHDFVDRGVAPRLKRLFIDEAQDLSQAQWRVVEKLAANADLVFICGDEDQAIFAWAGADVEYFVNLPGTVRILDLSHRVPAKVSDLAQQMIGQVGLRRKKSWQPSKVGGDIQWYPDEEAVDISQGEWLLLARNGYLLAPLEDVCRRQGYSYEGPGWSPLKSRSLAAIRAWERLRKGDKVSGVHVKQVYKFLKAGESYVATKATLAKLTDDQDFGMNDLVGSFGLMTTQIWHEALVKVTLAEREYFLALMRRHESLKVPRVRISTIHSAKGGEADNVLLVTDLAPRTYDDSYVNRDDELRVLYTALTRTKENLHLIQPKTQKAYEL